MSGLQLVLDLKEDKPGPTKYLNVEKWLGHALEDVTDTGVVDAPRRRILDIGAGPGYFGYVSQILGHEYTALDVKSDFYDRMRAWLGVRCIHHRVLSMQPLPAFAQRFDLVIGFRTPFFTNKLLKRMWNLDEWRFFLDDIRDNVLVPRGSLFLRMQDHAYVPGPVFGTPELMDYFQSRGAAISVPKMLVSFRELL
jgi:hypothetical protein